MKELTIRTRILFAQILLVILSLVSVSCIAYFLMTHYLKSLRREKLEYSARALSEQINRNIMTQKEIFDRILEDNNVFVDSVETLPIQTVLGYFTKFQNMYHEIGLVDLNGKKEYKLVDGKISEYKHDFSNDAIFQNALRFPGNLFISPLEQYVNRTLFVRFVLGKETQSDGFLGVFLVDVSLTKMTQELNYYKEGETGFAILIDSSGNILSQPSEGDVMQQISGLGKETEDLILQAKALKSGFGRVFFMGIDGVVAFFPVEKTDWSVMIILPYKEFMAGPNKLKNLVLLASAIILLIAIKIACIVSNPIADKLTKSKNELVEANRGLALKIEELTFVAFHDTLTLLPNRANFLGDLRVSLAYAKRNKDYMFAVVFLDIDRFKNVNDTLGHVAGDHLLKEIAHRLSISTRPYDKLARVARFGGDEFAILLSNVKSVTNVLNRLKNVIKQSIDLFGHEVYTTVSIGVAVSNPSYDDPEVMLRDADTAMYRAKALGKDCFVMYDEAMHAQTAAHLQMENSLRRAIDRNEFSLNYQPIVSCETNKIAGFEALLRWNMVPPDKFIPLAEEIGLIIPIGKVVLEKACRQMRAWHEKFAEFSHLTISVNISPRQFTPDLTESIKQILNETCLEPDRLKLEITESAIVNNPQLADELLSALKKLKLNIHLDDFGTGYSSLNHLYRFPLDVLKIDRSFVMVMCDNGRGLEIVKTIIAMANNMRMKVIAEGVETVTQLEELKKMGCNYYQGYLFSKPLDIEGVEVLLKKLILTET